MRETQATLKDIAEFFRLALIAEVCGQTTVVRWVDQVIASRTSLPFAFFDISTSESQPRSTTIGFLRDVPGQSTPDTPVHMLLGYCHASVELGTLTATQVLVRLYKMSVPEHFPESIYHALLSMEDELYLAHDQVYGTVDEVVTEFTNYLGQFAAYTSMIPTEGI